MNLVILAAGKGSRMKSEVPKGLQIIDDIGTNNIQNTINISKDIFENIYVVVNSNDELTFKKNIIGAELITINSGMGSGHALYETYKKVKFIEDIYLVWGDAVFVNNLIFKELMEFTCNYSIVPLNFVENPYVSFDITDGFYLKSVSFSKYGECSRYGYQDKCVFKLKSSDVYKALEVIHFATFKGGRYITEAKEFEFLYIIHTMYALNRKIKGYITNYADSVFSYNTKNELESIKEKIKKKCDTIDL